MTESSACRFRKSAASQILARMSVGGPEYSRYLNLLVSICPIFSHTQPVSGVIISRSTTTLASVQSEMQRGKSWTFKCPMGLSRSAQQSNQIRPYTPESTGSRPISEVKLVMAQSVLWWGTTREYCVLYLFFIGSIYSSISCSGAATGTSKEHAARCLSVCSQQPAAVQNLFPTHRFFVRYRPLPARPFFSTLFRGGE